MLKILKNNLERVLKKPEIMLTACIVIPFLIGIAVVFTNVKKKETIAYIPMKDSIYELPQDERYVIENLDKAPNMSELILGKYTFSVEETKSEFLITTMKNEYEYQAMKVFFETGSLPDGYISEDEEMKNRGTGTNILGFLTMLLLVLGVAFSTLFPEDRKLRTFSRILSSNITAKKYIAAQVIFTFVCVYVPTFLAIAGAKIIFKVNIGVDLATMVALVSVLALLSTSFGIFLASVLEENLNLIASGISIVTCVLAGCFININLNNQIFSTVIKILPQKALMDMIHGIEMGSTIRFYVPQVVFVLVWCAILFGAGTINTRKKLLTGNF